MSDNLTTEEIKKMNIYQKLDLARVYIGMVEKGITVGNFATKATYKATSESDVLTAVNEAERKARLVSYCTNQEIVDKGQFTSSNGGVKIWVRIKVEVVLVNIDNPEEKLTFIGFGDGFDPGDKALGKASTYANKYALMKGFKIPTGDDPDYFSSEQNDIKIKYATEEEVEEWRKLVGDENIQKAKKLYKVKSLTEVAEDEILKRIEISKKRLQEKEEREALANEENNF